MDYYTNKFLLCSFCANFIHLPNLWNHACYIYLWQEGTIITMTSKQGNSFVSQSLVKIASNITKTYHNWLTQKPTQQTHPKPLIPHFFKCWPCGKADMSKNSMAARNLRFDRITFNHMLVIFTPGCWWFRDPCKPVDMVNIPVIYRLLYVPGGGGFLPSTVGSMVLVYFPATSNLP